MKKLIQFFVMLGVALMPVLVTAQTAQDVMISDLNEYDITEFSVSGLESQALAGELVKFTAVVVSYPKSSGLSNPVTDGDGNVTAISRVHIFVTDTNAVEMGRPGMSIQIVESDYTTVDFLTRGDVVTFTGSLGFFNGTAQVDVESISLLGNVNAEFPQLAELTQPWEVPLSDINTFEDGDLAMNFENYSKYNGAYVKITGATVSNVSTGDRPNWAVNQSNSRIYVYDTSLRYRNDHAIGAEGYLPDYNARRVDSLDFEFEPPVAGANIDLSGFVNYVGDDPDGLVPDGNGALSISPFEDGVVWLNGTRFVDGDMVDGETFNWPNDVLVNGIPANISNVQLSDSTVEGGQQIDVTADIAGVDGATITAASLIYTNAGTTDTLMMSNTAGTSYSVTLPAFDNFTPVSFTIEASDDNGLTAVAPFSGKFSFFVGQGAIPSISALQRTGDLGTGRSPLEGDTVALDINATIVSSFSEDNVIVAQDTAAKWSGIFLEVTDDTEALNRGDVINITSGTVVEVEVNDFGVTNAPVTQLVNLEFTVTSTGANVDDVVPVLFTDDVIALEAQGEIEPYEGMLLKFEDATLISVDSFGEFQIANKKEGQTELSSSGVIVNEDLRLPEIGETDFPGDANRAAKDSVTFDAVYGIMSTNFGGGKIHPRGLDDMVADNWSNLTEYETISPQDSAEVVVSGDIEVTWEESNDYDQTKVTYVWNLFLASDSSSVVSVASDTDSTDAKVTLSYATVNQLLADAGLENGQTLEFVWNVEAASGGDTLKTELQFLTLEKSQMVSNEDTDKPVEFSLEQNYPNPFNPSTNIKFTLPQAADVTLTVYNVLGQKVSTLINKRLTAGAHNVPFNASNLASGMYIYRIEAGEFSSIKKMMLIK